MKTFIIAEAGVNHNGDLQTAFELIDAAKDSGADAVKFQTFLTAKNITKDTKMVDYQIDNMPDEGSQYTMIKKLELSFENFHQLKNYCDVKKIEFISTPDDRESVDFLVDKLKVSKIKIGSGELDNLPFIEYIAKKNVEMIISTGMSYLGEIEKVLEIVQKFNTKQLTFLHCTTNYPCPVDEVNLKAMNTIRSSFGVSVGYSDHTLGTEVPIAAVALGAEIIEKHLTLNQSLPGPDHAASLEPNQFKEMVQKIRLTERCLGTGRKQPNETELKTKMLVRRKILAAKDLDVGDILSFDNIIFKRSNEGLSIDRYTDIIGRKVNRKISADSPITLENLL